MRSLACARTLAAENIRVAQTKYKKYYDKHAKLISYSIGEWILIRFPQDETGKSRKLSRPWHGPYRITALTQTDVTAVKVYYPKEGAIQVHMNRDIKCPSGFPPGYFWYGNKRCGPSHPPKWINKLVKKSTSQ